jgi:hypothetical protein
MISTWALSLITNTKHRAFSNAGQASHIDEVVVEEWCFDDDELLTQYMTP